MVDVLIVGGGPAGLTAGLYAVRAGLSALLLEREFIGGQASTTDMIQNYPGFPGGIGGPELMMQFEAQASSQGLEIRYEAPLLLTLQGEVKRAQLRNETIEARCVILCMGASRRKLGASGEDQLVGRGISYCATCDGAFYSGKRVAVVGGSYSAVEDALYLAQRSDVLMIHRRDQLRALGQGVEQVLANSRIQVAWNTVVRSVNQAEGALALTLVDVHSKVERIELVAGCFVAVGTDPNTALVKDQLPLDQDGYINAQEDTLTSIPGVFAAGDIRKKQLKQVVTAVSDGAIAATMAVKHILGG